MRQQYHFRFTDQGHLIWDVNRLLELSAEFEPFDVTLKSIQELDMNFWYQQENDVPTCRSIAHHAKLIKETDLKYPIILSADNRVMDGMHRVCKAYLLGQKTIKAVQFKEDPKPDYIDVNLDDLSY